MTLNLYSLPSLGTTQNIQLLYNFDNLSFNTPVINTSLTTSTQLSNIRSLFPSFTTNYIGTVYNSFPINTQDNTQQISYTDTNTNSPIQYTIKFLHVGISPIQFNTTDKSDTFALTIDCVNSSGNILLIIIPLTVSADTAFQGNFQITSLFQNIKSVNTAAPVDLNKIIPLFTFNKYDIDSNRVILFNNSSIAYNNTIEPDFMNLISDAIRSQDTLLKTSTVSNDYSMYTSLASPQKKNILTQNDIYIDCYKVGESSAIDGGIINPDPQTNKIKSRRTNRDARFMIAIYILGALVGVGILWYILKYIWTKIRPVMPDDAAATAAEAAAAAAPKPKSGWFSNPFGAKPKA